MKSKPSTYEAMRAGSVRTYGDLIKVCRPSAEHGNCCACHKWGRDVGPFFRLSTRASICQQCCERKANEVLGSILRSERSARKYVANAIKRKEDVSKNYGFYSHLTGVPEEFIAAEYVRQTALSRAGGPLSKFLDAALS